MKNHQIKKFSVNFCKSVDRDFHGDTISSTSYVLVIQNIVLWGSSYAYRKFKKSTGEKVP